MFTKHVIRPNPRRDSLEADPFEQFDDKNAFQPSQPPPNPNRHNDLLTAFNIKNEKRLLRQVFDSKHPKVTFKQEENNIPRLKAIEALSDKHKNVNTWLKTTLSHDPNMQTMNKYVRMGLLKEKTPASMPSQSTKPQQAPKSNLLKARGGQPGGSGDQEPTKFDEIKSFFYIDLFEDDTPNRENLVDRKRLELKALIVQMAQRKQEERNIDDKLDDYKTQPDDKVELALQKGLCNYIIAHSKERILSILDHAPFLINDILFEIEGDLTDEVGRYLLDLAKQEIYTMDFSGLNTEKISPQGTLISRNPDTPIKQLQNAVKHPLREYRELVDTKVRQGRKFLEIDRLDVRAIKNRLSASSICEFLEVYKDFERQGALQKLQLAIEKSLCSIHRASKFLERLLLAEKLELEYLQKEGQSLSPSAPNPFANPVPSLGGEAEASPDPQSGGDNSIYSFLPFWYLDLNATADRKVRLLHEMLGINLALASQLHKMLAVNTLDQLIEYYRAHKFEATQVIFSDEQLRALVGMGFVPQLEAFLTLIPQLSEQEYNVPSLVFEYIKPKPDLEILEIQNIGGIPLPAYSAIVTSMLIHPNQLKGIRLINLDITADIFPILQFLINSKTKNIVEVTICDNDIRDEGAYRLMQFSKLKENNSVRVIRLEDCKITSQGAVYISSFLRETAYVVNTVRLQVLSLKRNNMGSAGFEAILFALRTNTSLEYLDLSYNQVKGNNGLHLVFEALRSNNTLQILDIRGNHFTDSSVQLVLEDASSFNNTALTVLKIGTVVAFPDHVAKLIKTCIPCFTKLKVCEITSPNASNDASGGVSKAIAALPRPILLKVNAKDQNQAQFSLVDLCIDKQYQPPQSATSQRRPSLQAKQTGAGLLSSPPSANAKERSVPPEVNDLITKLSEPKVDSSVLDCIYYLLETKLSPEMLLKEGDTFIHRMIACKQTELVNYMLKRGVDPNLTTLPTHSEFPGATLLHIAVAVHALPVIADLILFGAQIDAQDGNGNTPLHYAASLGELELCSFLIEKGCSPAVRNKKKMEPLHAAIVGDDIEVFEYFLEHRDAHENPAKAKEILQTPLIKGLNSLHIAIESNSEEIFQHLLGFDLDLDATDAQKRTPLHWAVEMNHPDIVQPLLRKRINMNARDCHGETPIFFAVRKGNLELTNMLHKRGAECVNVENARGENLMHIGAKADSVELIYWLLLRGVDSTKQNIFNQYPKDLARSQAVKDLLPTVSEAPRFDMYSLDPNFLRFMEKQKELDLKAQEQLKRMNTRPTNEDNEDEDEEDDDGEEEDDPDDENDEDGDGEDEEEDGVNNGEQDDGEEEGQQQEEDDEEEEDENRDNGRGNNRKMADGEGDLQGEEYDDDDYYEDNRDEPSVRSRGGQGQVVQQPNNVNRLNGEGRAQAAQPIKMIPQQRGVINEPKRSPSIDNERLSNYGNVGAVGNKGRSMTPIKRMDPTESPAANRNNKSFNAGYAGYNSEDQRYRNSGMNMQNQGMRQGRTLTPTQNALPPMKLSSLRSGNKAVKPFAEDDERYGRSQGNNSSYLAYLDERQVKDGGNGQPRKPQLPPIYN